jgi:hypothetical protein
MNGKFINQAAALALLALVAIAGNNQAEACGGNQCGIVPGVSQDQIYGASTRFTAGTAGFAGGGWSATGAPARGSNEAFTRGLSTSTTTGNGRYDGSTCANCNDVRFHLQGSFRAQHESGAQTSVLQQGQQLGSVAVGAHTGTDVFGTGAFRFQNRR